MKGNSLQRFKVQFLCLGFLVVAASWCFGSEPGDSVAHEPQGFTEPWLRVEISAAESGRVASIAMQKGTIVRPGQLLMSLDKTVLEARRNIVLAQSKSRSELHASKVRAELALRRLEAVKKLQRTGGTSLDELVEAEGAHKIALHEIDAAEETLQQRQLELLEIEARIAQREVRSSISGVVTEVLYEVGEFVTPSNPEVAVIIDRRRLRTTFFLETEHAMTLRVGQPLEVRMPSLRSKAIAVVEYVGVETIANCGRVQVDLSIDNADLKYRSGVRCTLAQASLPGGSRFDRLKTARETSPQKRN